MTVNTGNARGADPATRRRPRVAILGGGFAGVYAARELENIAGDSIEIAIINRENHFIYYPLMPEVVSGQVETEAILNPIRQVVPGADLYVGEATSIDIPNQLIGMRHGLYGHRQIPRTLKWDHLVIALGGSAAHEMVPGLGKYGFDVQRLASAFALRNHLIDILEQADIEPDARRRTEMLTFTIIGGGATGVEVAAEVYELLGRAAQFYPHIDPDELHVMLVQSGDRLIPDFPKRLTDYTEKILTDRGIDIRFNTRVSEVHADSVVLDSGERVPTRTVVGSIGLKTNPLVGDLPVPHDERGRLVANDDLSVGDCDNVWAIGDNAQIMNPHTGSPYPQTAQHAVRAATLVAQNIVASLTGESTKPMTYKTKGQMVPLGHRNAVADIYGFTLSGMPAWFLWRNYYLLQLPRWAKRVHVIYNWTSGMFFPPDIVQLKVGRPTAPTSDEDQAAPKPPSERESDHQAAGE